MSQEMMDDDFEEIKMPMREDNENFENIEIPGKGRFAGGRRSSSVEAVDSFERIDIQDGKDVEDDEDVEMVQHKVILKKTESFEKVELPQPQVSFSSTVLEREIIKKLGHFKNVKETFSRCN